MGQSGLKFFERRAQGQLKVFFLTYTFNGQSGKNPSFYQNWWSKILKVYKVTTKLNDVQFKNHNVAFFDIILLFSILKHNHFFIQTFKGQFDIPSHKIHCCLLQKLFVLTLRIRRSSGWMFWHFWAYRAYWELYLLKPFIYKLLSLISHQFTSSRVFPLQ